MVRKKHKAKSLKKLLLENKLFIIKFINDNIKIPHCINKSQESYIRI